MTDPKGAFLKDWLATTEKTMATIKHCAKQSVAAARGAAAAVAAVACAHTPSPRVCVWVCVV